jgi:hypothetical protein
MLDYTHTHTRARDHTLFGKEHGSAVGIATGYGLDDRGIGVRVPVESEIVISPYRSDRLCSPPSWYRGLFPQG